jgi:hypothetical protein
MEIQWYRDLIICITAPVTAITLVIIAVVSCMRYRRTRRIADAIDTAALNINEIIFSVREDIINPALQIMSVVKGIRQGIEMVNKFMGKEERKNVRS